MKQFHTIHQSAATHQDEVNNWLINKKVFLSIAYCRNEKNWFLYTMPFNRPHEGRGFNFHSMRENETQAKKTIS